MSHNWTAPRQTAHHGLAGEKQKVESRNRNVVIVQRIAEAALSDIRRPRAAAGLGGIEEVESGESELFLGSGGRAAGLRERVGGEILDAASREAISASGQRDDGGGKQKAESRK